MNALKPLTISKSTEGNPTVLLTDEYKSFLLYKPLDDHLLIGDNLFRFILKHFKVNTLQTGYFKMGDKSLFAIEQTDGTIAMDTWYAYLWENKRSFNQFLNPRIFFDSFLIDLFFPIWGGSSKKVVLPEKKNIISVYPVPANNFSGVAFEPVNFNQLGLNHYAYKRFLNYFKEDLMTYLNAFLVLHHEKFQSDMKFQLSLYHSLRNAYWDEIKPCFDPSFVQYTAASVKDYILRL